MLSTARVMNLKIADVASFACIGCSYERRRSAETVENISWSGKAQSGATGQSRVGYNTSRYAPIHESEESKSMKGTSRKISRRAEMIGTIDWSSCTVGKFTTISPNAMLQWTLEAGCHRH